MSTTVSPGFLSVCTYNMHGYNTGVSYLKQLCMQNDIIFIQEHWLLNSQLSRFNSIDQDFMFSGKSAMNERMSTQLIRGRPFGGVGVLYRRSLGSIITYYGCSDDSRVVVIKLENGSQNMLVFGVYFPCDDHRSEYLHSIQQILGYIESVIEAHIGYKCVILGDFNFECKTSNVGFCEFTKLANDYNLSVCDDLDPCNSNYSYCHVSLDQKSLIDHVFVSHDLKTSVHNYSILCDGSNLSDHSPIHFHLSYDVCHSPSRTAIPSRVYEYRWDKGDVQSYYLYTGYLLDKICHVFPCVDSDHNCVNTDHHLDIEIYYAEIVNCLLTAAKLFIPRIPKSALKHYWSVALDDLKHESCSAHNVWLAAGKPRSGQLFELKKNAHYKYKLAIKDAAAAFEQKFSDELMEYFFKKKT